MGVRVVVSSRRDPSLPGSPGSWSRVTSGQTGPDVGIGSPNPSSVVVGKGTLGDRTSSVSRQGTSGTYPSSPCLDETPRGQTTPGIEERSICLCVCVCRGPPKNSRRTFSTRTSDRNLGFSFPPSHTCFLPEGRKGTRGGGVGRQGGGASRVPRPTPGCQGSRVRHSSSSSRL